MPPLLFLHVFFVSVLNAGKNGVSRRKGFKSKFVQVPRERERAQVLGGVARHKKQQTTSCVPPSVRMMFTGIYLRRALAGARPAQEGGKYATQTPFIFDDVLCSPSIQPERPKMHTLRSSRLILVWPGKLTLSVFDCELPEGVVFFFFFLS